MPSQRPAVFFKSVCGAEFSVVLQLLFLLMLSFATSVSGESLRLILRFFGRLAGSLHAFWQKTMLQSYLWDPVLCPSSILSVPTGLGLLLLLRWYFIGPLIEMCRQYIVLWWFKFIFITLVITLSPSVLHLLCATMQLLILTALFRVTQQSKTRS